MSEEFNYEISTMYKPEFEKLLTYENLYNTINNERIKSGSEPDSFSSREIFTRRDSSGILNKLISQLHFNLKDYAKNPKDKYDVLKLMYFIINTSKRDNINELKTVSVIDFMIKPTLEHTDFNNSVYKNDFRNYMTELRKGVTQPDCKESEIQYIHDVWNNLFLNLEYALVENAFTNSNDLERMVRDLKHLIDSVNIEEVYHSIPPKEGAIDTFYNMMLSHRVVSEISDHLKTIYDYTDEVKITQKTQQLTINNFFLRHVTWSDFLSLIDIKHVNLDNENSKNLWSLLLLKNDICIDDIKSIKKTDYNFAKKYTQQIVTFCQERRLIPSGDVSLFNWIVVMQELMYINHSKIKYKNTFIRHTNSENSLTAAIKNFERSSEFPKQIIQSRLINRRLLISCGEEALKNKKTIDNYILEIQKIIFSYKNIEDIKVAYNYLYLQTSAILNTSIFLELTSAKFMLNINNALNKLNPYLPAICMPDVKTDYSSMLLFSILSLDETYRCKDSYTCNEQNKEFHKLYKTSDLSEKAFNTLRYELSNEMQYIFSSIGLYTKNPVISRIFTIPIYLGQKNQYYCCVRFAFDIYRNTLKINQINFIGKDIKQIDIYKKLFLM